MPENRHRPIPWGSSAHAGTHPRRAPKDPVSFLPSPPSEAPKTAEAVEERIQRLETTLDCNLSLEEVFEKHSPPPLPSFDVFTRLFADPDFERFVEG